MTEKNARESHPNQLRDPAPKLSHRPPWWRRRYVVNRDFQLKFAWSAVTIGLVSSAASSFMILLSFWSFNIWQGQRLPAPVMLTILIVMLTNVAGIYVVAVLTTQRVAGPLFNLMRQFHELTRHRFDVRVKLRKKDDLQYIARRFNEMAESLEKRDLELYLAVQEARRLLTSGEIQKSEAHLQALLDSEGFSSARRKVLEGSSESEDAQEAPS